MKINPKIYSLLSVKLGEVEAGRIIGKAKEYPGSLVLGVETNKLGQPVLVLEKLDEERDYISSNHTIVVIGANNQTAVAYTTNSGFPNEKNELYIEDIQMPINISSLGYGNILMKEIKKQAEKLNKTHVTGSMFVDDPSDKEHWDRLKNFYNTHGFETKDGSNDIKCDIKKWPPGSRNKTGEKHNQINKAYLGRYSSYER